VSDYLYGRVVIVSPHLDDGVLSLGGSIAAAVRRGAEVTVVTVFCGDPFSQASAGPWDENSGFASEGEAARARREEDRAACDILGAALSWLPFADEQYDRRGGEREVGSAIARATAGADVVMIPGWPLTNPDHAWLSRVLLKRRMDCGRIGLYVEQPYAFNDRARQVGLAAALQLTLGKTPSWQRVPAARHDQRLKLAAISAYRSQLRQLGLGYIGLRRMLHHERSLGGEVMAWLS
jgi:LmbE family N-acetylglucosaminyl deacetylase